MYFHFGSFFNVTTQLILWFSVDTKKIFIKVRHILRVNENKLQDIFYIKYINVNCKKICFSFFFLKCVLHLNI